MNANVLINSFNTGEISGLCESRSDLAKFSSACRTLENAIPLVEGGAKKMPGTYFVGATANGGAMFTASIAGTTMSVTAVNYGVLQVGQTIVAPGVASGTTISAYVIGTGGVGNYTITPTQTVASETMQTASNGMSRLVPFQFSTNQGAILEFSAGIARVWEGATEGSWSLGLALEIGNLQNYNSSNLFSTYTIASIGVDDGGLYSTNTPPTVHLSGSGVGGGAALAVMVPAGHMVYTIGRITVTDPGSYTGPVTVSFSGGAQTSAPSATAYLSGGGGGSPTAYIAGTLVLVGPTAFISSSTGTPAGKLYIAAPYGTPNASSVPITFTVNTSDVLSVTKTGVSPNQGINIALSNTTAAHNSAALIQNAVQALASLNASGSNFISLAGWTVTPDTIYYASPWITVPSLAGGATYFSCVNQNWIAVSVLANQYDQFPLISPSVWNSTYWQDGSQLATLPLEMVTPYLEADLFSLDCSTQSADVLWVFHPNYPPGMIQRLSANSWTYSLTLPGQQPGESAYRGTLDVVKTGYSALGQNITLISQANPCVVVLASSSASQPFLDGSRIYINECSGLVSLNEGEFLVSGMTYGSVTVSVTDSSGTTTNVTGIGWYFTPQDPNTGASIDSSSYQQYTGGGFAVQVVAMFAATGDYPACGALYQERLMVGGSNNNPTQLNGSVEDDYPDFICDPNADDYAVQYTLVSNQVNQLLNMVGTPNALVIGTSGGIWIVAGSNSSALSQTDVTASQQSSGGVSALQPQVVNGSAIFVSRSARIVTFLAYNFVTNQWDNTDLTRLNRNITIGTSAAMSGIAQTAFQMEPYPIYWAVRNDGQLIGLVFNTQDQVYAWFRVNMGAGLIESLAVISGQNQEDQIVVVVNRTINGVTQRYVEYFMPQELFGQLSNAFFVNCGLQWQGVGPFNITGITNAVPAVVTAPGHTLVNGQTVAIANAQGMTQVNTNPLQAWTVANVSGNTFQLQGSDSTAWGAYAGGGTVEQVTNQVTGMSYLMGQNVTAVGDEAVIYTGIVTADTVVFGSYANQITIGLPYTSTIEPMNPVLGDQKNTSKSKRQKFPRVNLSMYESVGGMVGTDSTHLYNIDYTQGTPNPLPPGSPATLFTGNVINDLDAEWTDEGTIHVVHSDPFPFTLRSVTPRLSVAEEG
jgi:hypothetical protein